MKHILGVYGTLKQGHGNNVLLDGSKLLGIQRVPGFKMYSLGGFPGINKADENSSIEVEVYEVDSPEVLKRIYSLEGYSGKRDNPDNWYDTVEVPTDWGTAEMFYFKEDMQSTHSLVEDGVWRGRQW